MLHNLCMQTHMPHTSNSHICLFFSLLLNTIMLLSVMIYTPSSLIDSLLVWLYLWQVIELTFFLIFNMGGAWTDMVCSRETVIRMGVKTLDTRTTLLLAAHTRFKVSNKLFFLCISTFFFCAKIFKTMWLTLKRWTA